MKSFKQLRSQVSIITVLLKNLYYVTLSIISYDQVKHLTYYVYIKKRVIMKKNLM